MKYSFIIFCLFLISCEEHEYYTITSPDKTKCLTIDEITAMRPNFKSYLKIYYGAGSINKKEYIKMQWFDYGGFEINWETVPIKLKGEVIIENTIPILVIAANDRFKEKMNSKEDSLFYKTGAWRVYDFELLANGKYERCK